MKTNLLSLLDLVSHGGRVQPDNDKRQETSNHRPQTGDPDPASADGPTARVLVVRKVAHRHLVLLLDIGEEGALVVDAEREDAVLIGSDKLGAVHGASLRAAGGLEGQTVEGREHGEFKLELILGGELKGNPLVVGVFRHLNAEELQQ